MIIPARRFQSRFSSSVKRGVRDALKDILVTLLIEMHGKMDITDESIELMKDAMKMIFSGAIVEGYSKVRDVKVEPL